MESLGAGGDLAPSEIWDIVNVLSQKLKTTREKLEAIQAVRVLLLSCLSDPTLKQAQENQQLRRMASKCLPHVESSRLKIFCVIDEASGEPSIGGACSVEICSVSCLISKISNLAVIDIHAAIFSLLSKCKSCKQP